MKLLLFSDLHANTRAATRIVGLSEGVDAVIGAGDFANFRSGISDIIRTLSAIRMPTILVPGNHESCEELLEACAGWRNATVLHGSRVDLGGVPCFGIGGGIPVTPFGGWSYDFPESEAVRLLSGCPAGAVLVSHSPPKGAVDVSSSGRDLGSTALRDAIVRLRPRLVVCGHIHESGGRSALMGDTPVINAGPAGMTYELESP